MIYSGVDTYYDILAARGMMSNNIEEIYDCLTNEDYRVRSFAAQTIQVSYATERSFKISVKMLSSSQAYQREIGAYILGQLGTPKMPFVKESLPLLYKLFEDNDEEVVVVSISSVAHLWSYTDSSDNESINKIIEFTKHKNPEIRISAVMALASSKYTKKVRETIYKLLNDEDEEVREWAEVAQEIIED